MTFKKALPKSVNVNGHVYKIKVVDESGLSPGAAAHFDASNMEIRVLKTQSIEELWRSLLHEIRHAQQYESGFMQIMSAQILELDSEGFSSLIMSLKKQKIL